MGDFFLEAVIYLAAAVICVPIAKKAGLSSVLGYIFAGVLIGPYLLGLIGTKGEDIMHFSEFGVVMMLFLIGLELDPHKFWKMRRFIVGMGFFQLIVTTLILFLIQFLFLNWAWNISLAIALALSLSSTAIVLQTLSEKGLNGTSAGRSSFVILLFQDISVIPILALLPLMVLGVANVHFHEEEVLTEGLSPGMKTLVVLGAILALTLIGKFIVGPILRIVAQTRLQELFTATALLIVMSVSYLMQMVGLSPALGAFMAGVLLANSEFKHELEGDIAPFKGLLLGLFFLGVGASINLPLIVNDTAFVFGAVLVLLTVKFIVLYLLGKLYKIGVDQKILLAILLSQAGEFGFVILNYTEQLRMIPFEITDKIMAVIAVSMVITPVLLLINEKWIDPYFGVMEKDESTMDNPEEAETQVIIAGFGHFGSSIGRLLRVNQIPMSILDHDSERVDFLRKLGFRVYYGDALRLEILKLAGAKNAKLFIAAIDNPTINIQLIETVRKHFPHLKIMSRARNRLDAYEIIDHGVDDVYRETFYTAVHLGVDALVELGHPRNLANRQGWRFIKYDEDTTRRLAAKRHDKMSFLASLQEEIEMQEELIRSDSLEYLKKKKEDSSGRKLMKESD